LNSATDGPESENLGLDGISISGVSVRVDVVERVSLGLEAVLRHQFSELCGNWGSAISANKCSSAGISVLDVVLCSVLHAGNVRNSVVEDVLSSSVGLASVASEVLSVGAINDNLGCKGNRRSGVLSIVSDMHHVESVGSGRGHALGPAGSAVVWDVLVFGPGKVVDGLSIENAVLSVGSPVHGLGNVGLGLVEHGLFGFGKWWRRSLPSLRGSPAAVIRLLLHETVGLRHQVGLSYGIFSVGVVVLWVVPLSISGHVLDRICPVVDGVGPGAVALDGHVVLASD